MSQVISKLGLRIVGGQSLASYCTATVSVSSPGNVSTRNQRGHGLGMVLYYRASEDNRIKSIPRRSA